MLVIDTSTQNMPSQIGAVLSIKPSLGALDIASCKVYCDTVGDANRWRERLEQKFEAIRLACLAIHRTQEQYMHVGGEEQNEKTRDH